MLPLFTSCQGPDGAGSETCQKSPHPEVWAGIGLARVLPAHCVTLGRTRPFLVTGGFIRNPRLLTRGGASGSVPLWVGKRSSLRYVGYWALGERDGG